jgi:hypothetical protein
MNTASKNSGLVIASRIIGVVFLIALLLFVLMLVGGVARVLWSATVFGWNVAGRVVP